MHALAEADPTEQFDDLVAITRLVASLNAQRQRDVFVGGEVVEQAKILEDDADAAAQGRDRVFVERGDIAAEQTDEAARRLQREQDELQQGRLAGARGAGQELERLRLDAKADVLEDLAAHAVAQADVFECDQTTPLSAGFTKSQRELTSL